MGKGTNEVHMSKNGKVPHQRKKRGSIILLFYILGGCTKPETFQQCSIQAEYAQIKPANPPDRHIGRKCTMG